MILHLKYTFYIRTIFRYQWVLRHLWNGSKMQALDMYEHIHTFSHGQQHWGFLNGIPISIDVVPCGGPSVFKHLFFILSTMFLEKRNHSLSKRIQRQSQKPRGAHPLKIGNGGPQIHSTHSWPCSLSIQHKNFILGGKHSCFLSLFGFMASCWRRFLPIVLVDSLVQCIMYMVHHTIHTTLLLGCLASLGPTKRSLKSSQGRLPRLGWFQELEASIDTCTGQRRDKENLRTKKEKPDRPLSHPHILKSSIHLLFSQRPVGFVTIFWKIQHALVRSAFLECW